MSYTPIPETMEFAPGLLDSFGHIITGTINNQVDIQFYRGTPASLVTVTTASGGTATATGGMATFAATAAASSQAKGVTNTTTIYTAGGELYALFTAAFPAPGSGTSYQRIGLYDTSDGLFLGYEGAAFGITLRKTSVDSRVLQAAFSVDTLTGGAASKFTRNGVPEALDPTKLNVYRIRMGWVGSAPITFEVLAPDGKWVIFHKILQPNLSALPSIDEADLPVTCDVFSGNSGTALSILSNCWGAGTTQALYKVGSTITSNSLAALTRAVITGETTGGGGGFVNVKVAPSGALVVDTGITQLVDAGSGKTLKTASFSLAATGSIVSAVGGRRIKVYAYKVVCSAALTIAFRDGAATALEGGQSMAANGGAVEGVNPPSFLFATTAGNSLDLIITGAGTAAGRVSYWDDDAT